MIHEWSRKGARTRRHGTAEARGQQGWGFHRFAVHAVHVVAVRAREIW